MKFGCEISGEGLHLARIIRVHENHPFLFNADVLLGGYEIIEGQDYDKRSMQILGRSIRLADCVEAIIQSKKWKAKSTVEQAKDFYNLNLRWKTMNDNLNNASDETKQFLYDLLVGEKE